MKPFRGKRMGPRSQPGDSASRAVARAGFGSVGPSSFSSAVGWRTFPGERHYRLSGGQKPVAKVASLRTGEAWLGVGLSGGRGKSRSCPWARLCVRLWWTVLSAPGLRAVGCRVNSGWRELANRSAPYPTRLETRTKESNMCASHGVLRNPKAQ